MRLTRYALVILAVVLAVSAFPATALGQTNSSAADAAAVATITQMENASVKADMAGDSSFVEKNYAENFTGGSSWGNWETKQSILADMKDSKNNKTNCPREICLRDRQTEGNVQPPDSLEAFPPDGPERIIPIRSRSASTSVI